MKLQADRLGQQYAFDLLPPGTEKPFAFPSRRSTDSSDFVESDVDDVDVGLNKIGTVSRPSTGRSPGSCNGAQRRIYSRFQHSVRPG